MKKWIAAAALAGASLFVANRMRAQQNERDLWAEVSDDVTPDDIAH